MRQIALFKTPLKIILKWLFQLNRQSERAIVQFDLYNVAPWKKSSLPQK